MSFSRDSTAVIFSVLFVLTCQAQEIQEDSIAIEKRSWNSDVLGKIQVGFILPQAGGTNFVNQGYELNPGFALKGEIVKNEFSYGGQYNRFDGNVVDISSVGGIDQTTFTHVQVYGGYCPVKSRVIQLTTHAGFGYAAFINSVGSTRFSDSGFSVLLDAELSFRLSNGFALYLNLAQTWDFLTIETPPEIQSNFNSTRFLIPSFGIQIITF